MLFVSDIRHDEAGISNDLYDFLQVINIKSIFFIHSDVFGWIKLICNFIGILNIFFSNDIVTNKTRYETHELIRGTLFVKIQRIRAS